MKRQAPSSSGVTCVATILLAGRGSAASDLNDQCESILFDDSFSRAKRPKLSHKQIEEKANYVFMEYWLAQRKQAPKLSPPPVSAVDRKAALLARVVARSSGNS